MTTPIYGQVEYTIKQWLTGTSVAPLVTRADGGISIYLAMPKAAPVPVVLIRMIGGGPNARADYPLARYRLSFDVLGASRDQANLIMRTLVSELQALGEADVYVVDAVVKTASVLNIRWQPDPDTDTPRYIVDALITTVL